jgi:hypothetical protein
MSETKDSPPESKASEAHKTFQSAQLSEQKFDLAQLMKEVAMERKSSSLAKQIIDQKEIQKTIEEHLKKKKRGNNPNTPK